MQIDALGPADFRTRGALMRTMLHLRGLMDRKEPSFAKIHNFLFDRYRSVRQDLYVQGIEVKPWSPSRRAPSAASEDLGIYASGSGF